MKLITNANLELIIQEFYALLQEEFKPKQLEEARTLTIGETGKKFDGSQDVFWSLNEIGAAPKNDVGSISNLTTSNKSSVVAAINELQNNKATIAYVNDAISNVEIEDVVTASEFIGNIENIENDYVTQDELEDALANLDDIDIEGMVTAVDVGNVDIEQGGSNNGGSFDLSGITMYDIKAYADNETATVGSEIDALWTGYNELFQSANNGKELIASAIGEPLSSEQTFSAMSNDINSLLSTFKTNMMNSGVTVNSSDRFKSLIDKIKGLTEGEGNKGIQFAKISPIFGGYTNEESAETIRLWTDMGVSSFGYMPVNVDFEPSLVIHFVTYQYREMEMYCYSIVDVTSNKYHFNFAFSSDDIYEDYRVSYYHDYDVQYTGKVYLLGDDIKNITTNICYAIGVGEEDTTLRDSLADILQEEGVSVTEEDNMASLISKVDSEFNRQVVPQGTAVASDVLSGKTFINSTGQTITGTAAIKPPGYNIIYNAGTLNTDAIGGFEHQVYESSANKSELLYNNDCISITSVNSAGPLNPACYLLSEYPIIAYPHTKLRVTYKTRASENASSYTFVFSVDFVKPVATGDRLGEYNMTSTKSTMLYGVGILDYSEVKTIDIDIPNNKAPFYLMIKAQHLRSSSTNLHLYIYKIELI